MTKAISIDYAVSGFIRRRFIRALWSSRFVLISLFLIYMLVGFVPQEIGAGRGVSLIWNLPFLTLLSLLWIFALSAVLGGVVEVLHRRFTALFLVAGSGFLAYYLARDLYTPVYWLWIQLEDLPAYNPTDLTSALGLATLPVLASSFLTKAFVTPFGN